MAINSIFYLDAADLESATSVYLDLSLTLIAPDGFYGDGTITREQSGGVLLEAEDCAACATPCGTSISTAGNQGVYQINLDVGIETGAVRVIINPQSIPDGIRVTYDGVVYNKISSPIYGVRQAPNPGHYTIVGTTGFTDDCSFFPSGATITQDIYLYNRNIPGPNKWELTGGTQTNVIAGPPSPDFFIESSEFGSCIMIIPKVNATPNIMLIEIIGPCGGTGWSFSAACPAALPTFSASNVFATADVPCAQILSNTYYFAKVHTAVDTFVGLYDYVFTDENGEFPLANGFYLIDNVAAPNKVIQVQNGVVIGITNCI
jgi:hypothetical protein